MSAIAMCHRPIGLEDDLRDGVTDLAIDWLPVERDPFVSEILFDDHVALLARRDHPVVKAGVTIKDLEKAWFVTLHARREFAQAPPAVREVFSLAIRNVAVRVSETLEVPTVVASTDLVGIFLASMGPLMERSGLGLRVLPIPLELPLMPIFMIWHEPRRHDPAHRWRREIVVAELSRFANG